MVNITVTCVQVPMLRIAAAIRGLKPELPSSAWGPRGRQIHWSLGKDSHRLLDRWAWTWMPVASPSSDPWPGLHDDLERCLQMI